MSVTVHVCYVPSSCSLCQSQHSRDFSFGQPLVLGIDKHGDDVGRDRRPNRHETQADVQVQVKQALGYGDRGQLTENRDPAQYNQRAQPDPVRAVLFWVVFVLICYGPNLLRMRQTDYL